MTPTTTTTRRERLEKRLRQLLDDKAAYYRGHGGNLANLVRLELDIRAELRREQG